MCRSTRRRSAICSTCSHSPITPTATITITVSAEQDGKRARPTGAPVFLCGSARPIVFRHQRAQARDQLFPILDGVGPRIVTADQKTGGTELVVFEHRLGDRLGRADEGGRV